ncbi:MAG TPA: hypothetical protein VK821_02405 [Dehalococcoidia bacterium]|nr:hypothetical protein [Dehalococcoidia bacterium]
MTIDAAHQFSLPHMPRRAPARATGLALLAALALATLASPASAQSPMQTMNPMNSPFMSTGGMFGQSMMQGPLYPFTYGAGMPGYGMSGSIYAPSYALPAATPSYSSSYAYSGTAGGYSTERTYTYSGQYCTDKTGGQVWVPTGGDMTDLNCNGAASSSSSGTGSGGSSGGGSGYGYTP